MTMIPEVSISPESEDGKECMLLVGGSGDTSERFKPLVIKLNARLPELAIATFTLSTKTASEENLLEKQTEELKQVVDQVAGSKIFGKYDIFCTSMGAYATVKLLIDPKQSRLINRAIFFDPADYYLLEKFDLANGEETWSGDMHYAPNKPTVSGELNRYKGEARIDVVHLPLRNYGPDGYVDKNYEDRGKDHDNAFPRLNTQMVKNFFKSIPDINKGRYLEVGELPHGFIRDGDIERNLGKVADVISRLVLN